MTLKTDPIRAVKAFLTDELRIDIRKNPVHCSMQDNSILIEGFVDGIAHKKKALFFAMGLEGAAGVIDRLRVRPSASMTDAEIKKHLYDALDQEPTIEPYGLRIEVNGGVVDLEGTVGSLSHKRLAGALAWWVPGSVDVINSLEVAPPEEDNDAEVCEALRLVLEKDVLVDAAGILVKSRDWVVTLSGAAATEDEKEAAGDDAWYIWGVNGVINNISVRPPGLHEIYQGPSTLP